MLLLLLLLLFYFVRLLPYFSVNNKDVCNVCATVTLSGTVERCVADPAVIATRQVPRFRCRVAVDSHPVIVNALGPDIRRQLNVLAAEHWRKQPAESAIVINKT